MKLKAKPSFAAFCRDIIGESISTAWSVAYKGFDGEPLDMLTELEIWRQMRGLAEYQPRDRREFVGNKGRRSMGTRTACKYLVYKIATGDYKRFAPRGQRLHVPVIAQIRDIATEVMRYFTDFYENSPVLRSEVSEILKHSIELKSGYIITVQTCSYRAPRGITAPLALLDEIGAWFSEGSNVDREVVRSLTPSMVQFPTRKVILLGTPWRKAGILHERWERRFEESDRLVLHCPTPLMNHLIAPEELERERLADPVSYRREFLGEWATDDVDAFIPDGDIDVSIQRDVREIPPVASLAEGGRYAAAIDASGLGGSDRFVFGVSHGGPDSGMALDCLRSWSKAPVAMVMDEVAATAKAYGCRSIVADQYSFPFIRELLEHRGVTVEQLAFTARSKPELFLDMKLWFSQGRIQMLDHPEALRELRMLESKRASGGRYVIAAPRGQHDDYAALLTLLVHECKTPERKPWVDFVWVDDDRRSNWQPLR